MAEITNRLYQGGSLFGGAFTVDGITQFFRVVFLLVAALVLLLSLDRKWGEHEGEYYALLVFATLGMTLMAGATELVTVYVALELTSISLYILAAFDFRAAFDRGRAEVLSLWGLFLGHPALRAEPGLWLYRDHALDGIASAIALAGGGTFEGLLQPGNAGLLLGLVLLVAGFGFKLALVPFHSWTPDVYEGAPTPITAFVSTGSKAASFVVFLRLMLQALAGAVRRPGQGASSGAGPASWPSWPW